MKIAAGFGGFSDKVQLTEDGEIRWQSSGDIVLLSLEEESDDAEASNDAPAGFTPTYAVKMVGAFVAELIYQNRLNSLSQCAVGGKETYDAITEAVNAMTKGDEHSAFVDGIKAMNSI